MRVIRVEMSAHPCSPLCHYTEYKRDVKDKQISFQESLFIFDYEVKANHKHRDGLFHSRSLCLSLVKIEKTLEYSFFYMQKENE